jgi:hypothetical protein
LDLKRRKTDHGENCIMISFMTCIFYGGVERCLKCFGWKPEGNRALEKPRCAWEGIRWSLRRYGSMMRTEFIWLRITVMNVLFP